MPNAVSGSRVKGRLTTLEFTGVVRSRIMFQYNPASVTRRLAEVAGVSGTTVSGAGGTLLGPQFRMPRETIEFRLKLDATDLLERSDPAALANGIYGPLSAMELLMYPQLPETEQLVVLEWGGRRVIPVEVTALEIVEEQFDGQLNPVRAEVGVSLAVLNQGGLPEWKQALWEAYFHELQQLAQL